MKKIIGLLILVGLYVAAAYYTGVQGEKNIRHQFALSEQQSEAQGLKLVLENYERGIFSSSMRFTATYGTENSPFEFGPIVLGSDTQMQHGPVLWKGGLGVGLFTSVSTIELSTGDDEIDQGLKTLFGESIGEIVTRGYFNNSYTAVWSLPAIDSSNEGSEFTLADSSMTFSGSYNNLDFVGSFAFGAMELATADGSKMSATPITGEFDVENISEYVSISNMTMNLDTLNFADASAVGFALEQLKVVQTQKLVNEKIDTSIRFSAEKFKGPVEVSALYYDLTLNQLDPVAMQKWVTLSQKMDAMVADPSSGFEKEMEELMDSALQEGLQFKVAVGADLMDGRARMDLTADYKPLPDGRKIAEIVNPEEYLTLVDGELLVTLSQSIVNQTPLALMMGQYVDTYVTLEGDEYRMHGKLKAGQLSVGTVEMPATMLLALMGMGAAGEPEQDYEADGQMMDDDGEEAMDYDTEDQYLDE